LFGEEDVGDADVSLVSFGCSAMDLFVSEFTREIVRFVVSDILDCIRIGGKSLSVVEAILFVANSILFDFETVLVDKLSLAGDIDDPTELFFNAIRDDFAREFADDTLIGVVFVRIALLVGRGVVEVAVRLNRRVNNRSGGFEVLIDRTDAMSRILRNK
jgi:hypothetical protein